MSDLKKTVDIVFSGEDKLSGTLAKMKSGFGGLVSGVTKVAKGVAVLGAAFTAAGVAGAIFVKKELETADGIAKTADAIGITTDKLQEYQFIAGRSGVATESMNSGFKTFAKRLGELQTTGKGALGSFLKDYNQDLAETLKGTKTTGEGLDIFMRYMAGVESQTEKTALSAAGFSKSVGVVMTNMVKGGILSLDELKAAFDRLGLNIEEGLLRGAEDAVDAMGDLSDVMRIGVMRAAIKLAPEMESLSKFFTENVDSIEDFSDAVVEFIKTDLAGWFKGVDWSAFATDMKNVAILMKDIGGGLASIAGKYNSFRRTMSESFTSKALTESPFLNPLAENTLISFLFKGGLAEIGTDAADLIGKLRGVGEETSNVLHQIPWDKAKEGAESVVSEWASINDEIEASIGEDLTFTPTLEWDEDSLKPLELIPTEKIIEIQLQGDIDRQLATIEAHADIVQNAMEWEAKLSIANAEADAQRVASAFTATASAIDSTAGAMSGLISQMSGDFTQRWEAEKALDQQLDIQREQADLQAKMLEEQIKFMELKNERIERGESLIRIDSTGLEPALEMVMWQILEKVQIRAAENLDDYLLGVPA